MIQGKNYLSFEEFCLRLDSIPGALAIIYHRRGVYKPKFVKTSSRLKAYMSLQFSLVTGLRLWDPDDTTGQVFWCDLDSVKSYLVLQGELF